MSDDDSTLRIDRQRVTLRLRVEDKLRDAIATGRFVPGQRLVERELCALLNVGRTSIREALRQLEAEGLINTVPHRGPTVNTISAEEAEHLYAVRALLEAYAGRKFAERRQPQDVEALSAAVARLNKAAGEGDLRGLIDATEDFYRALINGCGNPVLGQILSTLHARMTPQRIGAMRRPGRSRASVAEVREILDAISGGDPEAAEVACKRHVQSAARTVLSLLVADAQPHTTAARMTGARKRRG